MKFKERRKTYGNRKKNQKRTAQPLSNFFELLVSNNTIYTWKNTTLKILHRHHEQKVVFLSTCFLNAILVLFLW